MLQQPFSHNNDNSKVLYRYETSRFNNDYEIKIDLNEYRIIKETPKGFWIWIGWGLYENYLPNNYVSLEMEEHSKQELKANLKWVSNNCRKRFAYPTKREAQFNFKKRKESQVKIIKSQLSRAEDALRAINVLMSGSIVNINKSETN